MATTVTAVCANSLMLCLYHWQTITAMKALVTPTTVAKKNTTCRKGCPGTQNKRADRVRWVCKICLSSEMSCWSCRWSSGFSSLTTSLEISVMAFQSQVLLRWRNSHRSLSIQTMTGLVPSFWTINLHLEFRSGLSRLWHQISYAEKYCANFVDGAKVRWIRRLG